MCPAQAAKGPSAEPDPFWGAKLLGAPERASRRLGLPSVPPSPAPLQGRQEGQPYNFHAMPVLLELLLHRDGRGAGSSCFSHCPGRHGCAAGPQGAWMCLEVPFPGIRP